MLRADTGPLVDRPLRRFSALLIRCLECEKETRWGSRELLDRGIWAETAMLALDGKMVCSDCEEAGRPAREVSVRPWPPIHPGFRQSGAPPQRDRAGSA